MTMTLDHPRFAEFIERLSGPEACDFRHEPVTWCCKGGTDKTFTVTILRNMGFGEDAIRSSCAYFEARGGYCDCEIVLNVDRTAVEEALRTALETSEEEHP